jgi:DNA-binding beta-propeller fold protein YncE
VAGLVALAAAGVSACGGPAAGSGAPAPTDVAWVATGASVTQPGSSLTPVNLATGRPEAGVHVGSLPSALAFTPGDKTLLVLSQGDDTLHAVNPVTHALTHAVTTGVEPDALAVAPGGTGGRGIALVANLDSNSVTPVDLGTWRAGPPIAVGTEPVAIAVTTINGAATALVVDFGSDAVTPITLSTMAAGTPIAVGTSPEAIAVVGGQALVANFGDQTITPISTTTLAPGAPVALGVDPTGLAVAASGTTLYVCGGASVVPVTVAGLTVGAPIALPGAAQAIALGAKGATAWVALQAGGLIAVTLATGQVGRRIHLGGHPSAVVIAQH